MGEKKERGEEGKGKGRGTWCRLLQGHHSNNITKWRFCCLQQQNICFQGWKRRGCNRDGRGIVVFRSSEQLGCLRQDQDRAKVEEEVININENEKRVKNNFK